MLAIQLNKKAIISFCIFIAIVVKDILVGYLQVIPERSPANRLISWFFIIPIMIIGVVLSLQTIREIYLQSKYGGKSLFNINLFLSLPVLLCFLYVFGMIAYAFTL